MSYSIRRGTVADIGVLSTHRAAMFFDMGRVHDDATFEALVGASRRYFETALPSGEYIAWVAVDADAPDRIVAGAGVQCRHIMPFPIRGDGATGVAPGRQAIVMNVYTDHDWRRRGVARALMAEILAWGRAQPLDSLVLHASSEGRPLYEQLGFEATNEMAIVP